MKSLMKLFLLVTMLLGSGAAFAQEANDAAAKAKAEARAEMLETKAIETYTSTASSTSNYIYAISAGAAIAIAASFGAMSQARAASTALDAIGRNPGAAGKIQTPMIIGLALIESLIIYALVIAFLLQSKIPALPS